MARVIHADVPHAKPAYALVDRLFVATNFAVWAANALLHPTVRVVWKNAPRASSRPIVYLTWHRFNYLCVHAMRSLAPALRPTMVMHDGLFSRALTHEASAWFGFDTFVFRRRSAVSPRQQLADYVQTTRKHLLVLPDSGGPYGVVKPGSMEVAAKCDALVVPFVVRARGALVVSKRLRHALPLPFASLEVECATPLEGRTTNARECQRALDGLDACAQA